MLLKLKKNTHSNFIFDYEFQFTTFKNQRHSIYKTLANQPSIVQKHINNLIYYY